MLLKFIELYAAEKRTLERKTRTIRTRFEEFDADESSMYRLLFDGK